MAEYGERAIKAIHVDESGSGIAEAAGLFPYALLLLDAKHNSLAGGTGKSQDRQQGRGAPASGWPEGHTGLHPCARRRSIRGLITLAHWSGEIGPMTL